MAQYTKWLIKLGKTLGLFVLMANLMIVSVPRCTWLGDLFAAPRAETQEGSSCHGAASKSQASDGASFSNQHVCACELLSFSALAVPLLDFEPYVRFKAHSSRMLVFWLAIHQAAFISSPDPPYPKSGRAGFYRGG